MNNGAFSENQHLTRQMDIIPLETLDTPINIIGAGAIGSFTALNLAKMGFNNITVFDHDKIDIENMNCQFFRHSDIGRLKTEALFELVKDFTNIELSYVTGLWDGKPLEGIVIAAVDNMETRKQIFDAHFGVNPNTLLIIDPRMGAEQALMYAVNPFSNDDKVRYEKTLYTDAEAVQERCTAKSTMYTVSLISGMIASTVKGFLVDKKYPRNVMLDTKCLDMITTMAEA